MTERLPHRWPRLGMTFERYDELLAQQGGVCAIGGCGRGPVTRRLDVDHDHRSGVVRGLLCHSHNRRLWVGATPSELRAMADYLESTL